MGHLIAAAGAVEVAVCALAIRARRNADQRQLREPDPDCDLNLVVGAPRRQRVRVAMSNSFGFGGSNSCIVLRHPEEVDGDRRAPERRGSTHDAPHQVVITGTGAVCARRHGARTRSSTRCSPGRSAIAPITQWDTTRLAGARSPARSPTSTPRALVEDRKLHKLIRRTDLFGLYAAGRAIDGSGFVAHRDDAGRRPPRPSSTTAPASTSARAAATTRTSTTSSR